MPHAKRAPIRLPLVALALVAVVLQLAGGLDWLDQRLADPMQRWHAAGRQPPPDIVLVAIDQKSLEDMNELAGQWPWPRSVHAELVDGLAAHAPAAIAFDIMFNEADTFQPDSDEAFREVALAHADRLYFPSMLLRDGNPTPLAMLPPSFGAVRGPGADPAASASLLVPGVLDPRNWRGGLINFEADGDGTGRHLRLYREVGGWRLPGLSAMVARETGTTLPDRARVRLNWFGAPPPSLSYADVFNDIGQAEPRIAPTLAGKIVLISATAPGLNDNRPTPLAAQTPGPYVLTTGLANLRAGDWLRDIPSRWPLAAALVLALAWAFRRRASPIRIGLGLALATVVALAGTWLALELDHYAPVGAAMGLAWLGFGLLTVESQWLERREREATIGIFGRFLDPRVVQSLVADGTLDRERRPEARQISILFSDIRGFTTLSESRSPEAVVELLNRYFSKQVAVIFRHGGTLDKFIGDAIMAFWNAPADAPDHARRAVAAAIDMTHALDEFRRELLAIEPNLGEFDVGIGVHTGPAVVGFLGSDSRMEYTAIGDTVNLASRIEGTTKGVARVLVSAATREACGEAGFRFLPRGQFHVKGREQPVDLFEPERIATPSTPEDTSHGPNP